MKIRSVIIIVAVAVLLYGFAVSPAVAMYHPGVGRFMQRDHLEYADGMNRYQYVQSDPIGLLDPTGLATYCQNRQLNLWRRGPLNASDHYNPITHTFVYTTNPDGSLKDTYSWGNEYDSEGRGEWCKNRPEDRTAAQDAINQRDAYKNTPWYARPWAPNNFGPQVGNDSFDNYVDQAFQDRYNNPHHPSRHPNWWVTKNCKTESRNLLQDAARKRAKKEGWRPWFN